MKPAPEYEIALRNAAAMLQAWPTEMRADLERQMREQLVEGFTPEMGAEAAAEFAEAFMAKVKGRA